MRPLTATALLLFCSNCKNLPACTSEDSFESDVWFVWLLQQQAHDGIFIWLAYRRSWSTWFPSRLFSEWKPLSVPSLWLLWCADRPRLVVAQSPKWDSQPSNITSIQCIFSFQSGQQPLWVAEQISVVTLRLARYRKKERKSCLFYSDYSQILAFLATMSNFSLIQWNTSATRWIGSEFGSNIYAPPVSNATDCWWLSL